MKQHDERGRSTALGSDDLITSSTVHCHYRLLIHHHHPPSNALSPSYRLAGRKGVALSLSLTMSSSASSLSSSTVTSSSSAPPAAPAASTPFIAYDLRDASNGYVSVAIDGVDLLPSANIRDLRRAVFAANPNTLRGRDYPLLDVYPPGSSSDVLSLRDRAARPRDSIASVLSRATADDDDTLIIVARPLLPSAGVQGEQL